MAAMTETNPVPCPYTAGGCPLFQTVSSVPSTSCATTCSPPAERQQQSLPDLPSPPAATANNDGQTAAQSSSLAAWGPYLEFDITPALSVSNSAASSLDTPGYYAALATPPPPGPPSDPTPPAASGATEQGKRQLRDIEELLPMPKKSRQSPEPQASTSVSPTLPAGATFSDDDATSVDDKPSTPFISKLVYLLTHDEYMDYVRWDSTGRYVILAHNCPQTLEMLTKFFRHTTTASFVRQLNIYGFKRLSTTDLLATLEQSLSKSFATSDYCAFYNSKFFKPSAGRPCWTSKLKPAHKDRARTTKKRNAKKDSDDSPSP
ncbi:hypothetical protein OIV83_000978 [Microbotryomycetes sp. JL201]|nr:hypothetical protein OIV83_000978 [Microbotryomycetes sp. JL201]